MVSVRAGWAVWSKHQGTRDDYSVLAASAEPLNMSEFGKVLAHFAPGNPPAEAGTPASLPWVVLSRVGVSDKPYIGMSIQVPAGYVDGSGRPVSRTAYLCVSYDDIAREPVSYGGLYDSFHAVSIPTDDNGLVQLTIPALDPAAIARDILEFGVDVVAGTAALLLSGPVTITGPDLPDWQRRLRFLDAVAALLPFGYRARYTAATWSDAPASAQRFRIVFASRAGDKSHGVSWGTAVEPTSGDARKYSAFLRRATRPGSGVAGLTALVGYLSRQGQPYTFDQPGHAIEIIANFPPMISEDIDSRIIDVVKIRDAFRQHLDQGWPSETRRKALTPLITTADPRDAEIIRTRFPAIGGEDARELLPVVEDACRRLLWSGEDKGLIGVYLESLRPYRLDDQLLAALLAVPPEQEPEDGRLDKAAALIAGCAIDDPASYPLTLDALKGNPAVATALLVNVCAARGDAGARGTLSWLAPVLGPVLTPFAAVLEANADDDALADIGHDAVRDLGDPAGQAAIRHLLRIAYGRERLRLALPGVALWLSWEAVMGAESSLNSRCWRETAMEVIPGDVTEAAWLDLVLLAARADPKSLLTGKYAAPDFARVLAGQWQELTGALNESARLGQAADEKLTNSLIDYLGRIPWRADPATESAVTCLVQVLTADGPRPLLTAAVYDVAEALRKLSPGTAPEQIAEAYARACVGGLRTRQACEALGASGVITSGAQAEAMLRHLHQVLVTSKREDSVRWQENVTAAIASGAFGQQVAIEFAASLVPNSTREIAFNLRLLDIAVEYRVPAAKPVLTDDQHSYLERVDNLLKEILAKARKPQGGLLTKVWPWKQAGERGDDGVTG